MNRLSFLVFVLGSFLLQSCFPDSSPEVEFKIIDNNGAAVDGATVQLFCVPGDLAECDPEFEKQLEEAKTTTSAGKANFTVDRDAILKAVAYKIITDSTASVTITGQTFVKMISDEKTKTTLALADSLK